MTGKGMGTTMDSLIARCATVLVNHWPPFARYMALYGDLYVQQYRQRQALEQSDADIWLSGYSLGVQHGHAIAQRDGAHG